MSGFECTDVAEEAWMSDSAMLACSEALFAVAKIYRVELSADAEERDPHNRVSLKQAQHLVQRRKFQVRLDVAYNSSSYRQRNSEKRCAMSCGAGAGEPLQMVSYARLDP